VFSFPAHAHVGPGLPMIAELVARGHRVTYFVADRFVERVAATGAEAVAYPSTFPWFSGPQTEESGNPALRMMLDFFEEGIAPLETAFRRLSGDRPDLIAHDLAVSETARMLARKWGLPVVQLCPTLASNEQFSMSERQSAMADDSVPAPPIDPQDPQILDFVARRAKLLAETGLTDVDIDGFGGDTGLNVAFLPQEFQPLGHTFDERFAFVGPCLRGMDAPGEWAPPDDGRPVLLISLGTSHSPDRLKFFRLCVETFTGTPWQVVMTLGHHVEPGELGPLPDNIEAHQWVSHPEILRHAAVFMTHAGLGSVMESLYFGVPMVVVPQHVDQYVIGGQVDDLGLGRLMPRGSVTAEALRDAVAAVAADTRIAEALSVMRPRVTDPGGAAAGADALESWLEPTTEAVVE
jgi:MGT family glycosyltransferase